MFRRPNLASTLTAMTACVVMSANAATPESTRADGVTLRQGAEWVSAPSYPASNQVHISELPVAPEWKPGDPIIEVPRQVHGDPNAPAPIPANPVFGDDPLAARQRAFRAPEGSFGFNTPLLNIEGMRTTASPNDPTGDVGPLQYVMAINAAGGSQVSVYNKSTGAQIGANFTMASLVAGGTCATSGAGDPIILFDELASRWVLTEFTGTGNLLCVYLSSSADLSQVQTWTRYAFNFPAFPDYPKYGVWPQAYFVGANETATAGRWPLYAMDRARMLAGEPATVQRLTVPRLAGFGFQMSQPADIFGSTPPPPGSPGIFMRHRDDESHNAGSNDPTRDFIELFELTVDWSTPANSVVAGPIVIPVAEFSSNLQGLSTFLVFPQPDGQRIDAVRETVMHRLAYRRFPTHESLVGNFVTDLFLGPGSTYPDDTGAIRWFELRRGPLPLPADVLLRDGFEDPNFGLSWRLHQEGTYAPEDVPGVPADQADRWMGAIGMDRDGNIALGFNIVRQSPALSAGLRYTGRLATDPLGVMTQGEHVIATGSGSTGGTSFAQRWGDYSDLGIDPVDGCTFWYIGNYANSTVNPTNRRANRFVSFRHPTCGDPGIVITATTTTARVCPTSGATVNAAPLAVDFALVGGLNQPITLSFPGVPTGISGNASPNPVPAPGNQSSITLGANNTAGAGPNTVTLQAASGAVTATQNFTLTVETAAPPAPSLTAPADGATGVTATPTFSWAAVAGAIGYTIEASTTNNFASLLFSQTVTTTSFTPTTGLPGNTVIFWRVRSTNSCGGGAFSPTRSFTRAP